VAHLDVDADAETDAVVETDAVQFVPTSCRVVARHT